MAPDKDCPGTQPEDMQRIQALFESFFVSPERIPVSFQYGGKAFQGIQADWRPTVEKRRIDANLRELIFEGRDPVSGLILRVECQQYADFPVIEWVAWFINPGRQPSPILSDVLALDSAFEGREPSLYHCNGDFYSESGYTPVETPLPDGQALTFAPNGGRPCDGAFPYYRILFQEGGLSLAIGWPGQWSARFSGLPGGVEVQAGQQQTHFALQPGERVRTPRITLLAWSGASARAVNLWRRWYLAHILPRSHGQPLQPAMALCSPEEGEEFTAATEENQLRDIQKFRQLGFNFDVWWIDAGWYPCYNQDHERKWWNTGTWETDPERFPHGLKPVSDAAAQAGARLLVWFEPERVRPGTRLDRESPDWVLRSTKDDNSLLALGRPEVRTWLTEHVCRMIQENGLKIYRQDFNFEPLDHWRSNDAPDRQGMNENLHVQAYLQYWDDLLERNPGLWIDSCASGGRRNDLETMRRSVPLHFTDYGYGNHPVKLAFHRTLFEWIPYFKEVTLSWDEYGVERFDRKIDSFSYHCALAAMLFAAIDIRRGDYDIPLALQLSEMWRRVAPFLLYGDYYPLTPFHKSAGAWVSWQFDRPETGGGFIQAIRLQECPAESFTARLKGLDPAAQYQLENPESGETRQVSGADLMEKGLTFELPRRSGSIWLYQVKA